MDSTRANIPLTSNIRVVLEGEEEAGSPSLEKVVRDHGDRLRGDALIMVDGPRHASGRPTLSFGTRGIMSALVTVYGPARDLAQRQLRQLGAKPRARAGQAARVDEGRCRPHDDRRILRRRRAADGGGAQGDRRYPRRGAGVDEGIRLLEAGTEAERLELRHNLPTLNINAIEAGGGVGGQGRTIIPASASARLDLRLVKADRSR